jgi:hypothetical protein
MKEIWKKIKNYEDYMVSNLGRIKSLNKQKGFYYFDEIIMKTKPHKKTGYCHAFLVKNGIKQRYSVHRLVAESFIENLNNLATVNHINHIKHDNRVENLEWMTAIDNVREAQMGYKNKLSKKVKQYDNNFNLIKEWNCVRDIERELGINHGTINYYCKIKKLHKGSFWSW